MTSVGSSRSEQRTYLLGEIGGEVLAVERVGDIGGQEAELGAAVKAAASKATAEEGLGLGQTNHRVGKLDLVASAALKAREMLENRRLQDITAIDVEVRRRRLRIGLLDHGGG